MSDWKIVHRGSAGTEAGRFTVSLRHCVTASLRQFLAVLLVLLCALLSSTAASSDAIIITKAMTASSIAEVFVEESLIRAEIEIGGPDLAGFRHLMPDSVYQRLGYEPRPLAERLATFFGEDLVFQADGGAPLPGRVAFIEPRQRVPRDELTGEPLPAAEDEGETVIFVILEYPFTGHPSVLTMSPPQSEGGFAAANIGFVVFHLGLPVNDFRYFSTEETLDLDWEDPWYSKFRNRNLRRQYDSPMSAFLYVEPYEVRTEIITRPRDLEQWVDLGLDGRDTIPVDIQYDLKQKVAAFLAEHQNVTIDGQPVEGELDRINFLRRTLRTSMVIDPPEELDAVSATLGVIFVYPTEGLPQEAAMTWDLFSERIQRVPGAATDEAGPLRFFLVPDDNILWWKNFLKNPTLPTLVDIAPPPGLLLRLLGWAGWLFGLGLVAAVGLQARSSMRGGEISRWAIAVIAILLFATAAAFATTLPARVTDEKVEGIVAALLHNVYRAFDFREESTIYDVLDRSVTGDLLTQTYLETRRGLELASQGGARAKVKEIEMLEVEPHKLQGRPGFQARCTWTVAGSVGHWGHNHQRKNKYEAELTVEPVDGVWKLTRLDLLQEERI